MDRDKESTTIAVKNLLVIAQSLSTLPTSDPSFELRVTEYSLALDSLLNQFNIENIEPELLEELSSAHTSVISGISDVRDRAETDLFKLRKNRSMIVSYLRNSVGDDNEKSFKKDE